MKFRVTSRNGLVKFRTSVRGELRVGKPGFMYYTGEGVSLDYKEAEKWFLLAAEQGEQISQTCLGAMYATPQGVSQNYEAALKWYQKAAEQGNALAQFDLGGMHADGRGVPQDYKIAVKWWHKAAGQGFTAAQFSLGVMYAAGKGGLAKDDTEAFFWLTFGASMKSRFANSPFANAYDQVAANLTPVRYLQNSCTE